MPLFNLPRRLHKPFAFEIPTTVAAFCPTVYMCTHVLHLTQLQTLAKFGDGERHCVKAEKTNIFLRIYRISITDQQNDIIVRGCRTPVPLISADTSVLCRLMPEAN